MRGGFVVDKRNLCSIGVVVTGEVISGEIYEGSIGRTPNGKRPMVVKIEDQNARLICAREGDKVRIFMKYATQMDFNVGEVIHFE